MNLRKGLLLASLAAIVACDNDTRSCTDQSCTPLRIEIELDTALLSEPTIELVADGEPFSQTCSLPELDVYRPCVTQGGDLGEQFAVSTELLGREGSVVAIISVSNYGKAHRTGPNQLQLSIDGGGGEVFAEVFSPEYEDLGEFWGAGCGTCSSTEILRPLAD